MNHVMSYKEHIQNLTVNPFANPPKQYIIDESIHSYVLPNRGPYSSDHLLIIPKRYVSFLHQLNKEERDDLRALANLWLDKLHIYHQNISLLLRDAIVSHTNGKTIDHLHIHLIPSCAILAEHLVGASDREFYTTEKYSILCQDMKKRYIGDTIENNTIQKQDIVS